MLYRLSSVDALQVTSCESIIVKDSAAGDTLIIKVGNEAAVIAIRDILAYIRMEELKKSSPKVTINEPESTSTGA